MTRRKSLRRLLPSPVIVWALCFTPTTAFTSFKVGSHVLQKTPLAAKGSGRKKNSGRGGGQGFGGGAPPEKTYDKVATTPRADVIDTESAMREFFSANEEWHPMFLDFATSSSVPAMTFLGNSMDPAATLAFDFDNTRDSDPWRRLDGIPTGDADRKVLEDVLNCMEASLIDIPVNEQTKDDDDDLQFLEEGRRLLAISRFHVLQGVTGGSVECYDALFSTCWSELMELRFKNEASTGSLIVVPDYDFGNLQRFTDMNLLRPLEWLGLQTDFEVTSLHRGSPAIRLLHKLQDMPDEPWNEGIDGDVDSSTQL
ncbi:expressed unknown protein [Seminavis robusta]|uniref:Uncharacterized protein n=1 Tax=Seminavis robusta TaxID=568900 RepID=A0A9N8HAJ1_9STRA|nr:expressed unknown protein [Seminavis robusta]|eukprot:Sro244_g097080.1 n/a (312) ;mRNA; r:14078-15013